MIKRFTRIEEIRRTLNEIDSEEAYVIERLLSTVEDSLRNGFETHFYSQLKYRPELEKFCDYAGIKRDKIFGKEITLMLLPRESFEYVIDYAEKYLKRSGLND